MKLTRLTALLAAVFAGVALQHAAAQPLNLHNLSNVYTQNFDGLTISTNPFIGGSLPGEWNLYTNVTATSIGSTVGMDGNAVDSWTNSFAGGFKNLAGYFDYIGGTNFLGTEDPSYQTNEPNRCLGIRQIGSFGDPGASFVLKLQDTTNFHNFAMTLDMLNLDASSTRTTTWTVEYGYADPEYLIPTSFFPVAVYTNVAGAFTTYTTNIVFPDGTINNFGAQVWIRISALTPSDGSGNRETFAIDNVGLTWANGTGGFSRVHVLSNPQNTTVYSNATASLTVAASGTPAITFQWYKNGQMLSDAGNIVGSQTSNLQIRNATPADQGTYTCQVSNSDTNGTVYTDTSHGATVTVVDAPAANIGYLRTLVSTNDWFTVTNGTAMWRTTGLITTATNITAANTASYYLQDGSGGINLFVTGGSSFRPNMGDEVTAVGFLSSFNGSIEYVVDLTGATGYKNATQVQILSNNIAGYPQPKVLAWDNLWRGPTNQDLNFNYAGSVVLLTNVYFGTNAGVKTATSNKFLWVTNQFGKATQLAFYAQQDNDLTNRTMPSFAYSIQGFLLPFTSSYEIGITRWSDVVTSPLQIAVSHSGNSSTITWTAVPTTYTYSVLAATAVNGPYTPIATGLKFTTSNGTYTDTGASGPYKFYRVTSP